MFVGVFLHAITHPAGLVAAFGASLLGNGFRCVTLSAILGALVYRLTYYPLVWSPLLDMFTIFVASIAFFFWAAFGNRVVKPWIKSSLWKVNS